MTTQPFVSPRDALDIVFAYRNRAYGAYQLRRAYPRHLGRALGFGLLLIGFALAIPQILNAVSHAFPEPPPLNMVMVMGPPPDVVLDPPPPPPPPPTPPPPVRATVRFVPPTPTPDDQVRDEKPPAVEDVLNKAGDVSTTNRESTGEVAPSIDNKPDFPAIIEAPAPPSDDEEHLFVQKPPAFPGGEKDLLKYLAENIKYPPLARENNIQGTVAISFVIGKSGQVSDVQLVKDIGGGCGKEAMRVVQTMPKWIPGENNGIPVKVRFTLPVRFRLD
ncbi:MAG: TonB family protein [Lewinellaceae bacterium]|nr:TonB family protein [Lewinellaceae bacterium]